MAKDKSKQKTKPASTRPKSSSTLNQSNGVTNGTSDAISGSSSSALLSAFSPLPSSNLFAQVSTALDSHAVRIFDTTSGRVASRWAGNGSIEKVLSLAWVQLNGSAAAQDGKEKPRGKKRRKSSSSGEGAAPSEQAQADSTEANGAGEKHEALALGLANGSILIIHPQQSTVIQTLSNPASSAHGVTSLSYPDTSANLLWAGSSSGHVTAWSLPTLAGDSGALVSRYESAGTGWSKVAVQYTAEESVQILVAQHAIKLFEVAMPSSSSTKGDVQTQEAKLRATFTGHTTEVSQLSWLPFSGEAKKFSTRFASIAQSDRFVNIWQIPATSTETVAEGSLSATFGMSEDILRITSTPASSLSLITSTAGSAALVDTADTSSSAQAGDKKKRRNPVASLKAVSSLEVKGDDEGMEGVTNAKFGEPSAATILLSRSTLRPTFEEVTYRDANGSYVADISLKKSKGKGVLVSNDNESNVPIHRAAYSENQHSSILPASAAPQEESTAKQTTSASNAEPTLAERLHGLQMETADLTVERRAVNGVTSEKDGQPSRKNTARRIADATSLSSSLVQALHSTDVRLLESCLAQTDPRVIRSTVQRIPNVLVLPLVEVLVERLGRSTAKGFGGAGASGNGGVDAHRGHELLLWLRHVLLVHLGYLVTVPELVRKLANLHATLENRMNFHDQLLSLNGRLDLVVSQIDQKTTSTASGRRSNVKGKPSAGSIVASSAAGPSRYVEGEEDSAESSSEEEDSDEEEEDEEEEDEAEQEVIAPAEEGSDAEIEDLVMGSANGAEDEDESSDEDDQVLSVAERKQKLKKASKRMKKADKQKSLNANVKANGFLDVEADEATDDEEDDGELGLNGYRSFVKGGGEDSEEEDSEDQDAYESDFINDDEEEDEEESDEE